MGSLIMDKGDPQTEFFTPKEMKVIGIFLGALVLALAVILQLSE